MRHTRLAVGMVGWVLAFTSAALALPVKTETVSYPSGGETVSGYLAVPDSAGSHPALVVIHEWWGLNDWVKEQARKFAEHGYVALAPDLYRGKVADDPSLAHELSRGLPQDQGVRDLEAAFDYLASRPDVRHDKIGSVGWCMGGGYSLLLAENEPKLAACVVNYGSMPTDKDAIERIQAPVLGNFGAEDHGITPAAVQAFESAMKAAGKSIDVKEYEGAGHAFENPNNKAGYREAAAKDAWARMLAFLDRTLKGQ
ncbi:MAG TPA: dienelactone hydrolase family protein [Terriglobia bacterium]|nr:dienelactone hydrolase family protein [Terriglobia bacterium]